VLELLNIDYIKAHIEDKYQNNITKFSKEVGIGNGYMCHLLNKRREPGKKVINCFYNYCKKHKYKLSDFIFLG